MNDIVWQLRARACPAGEPWTGDNPKEDHGHTDCWLHHKAADEIERLRGLIATWVAARDKWNKAMWNSDLTTEQRSLIERELTRSINLLTVEAAWPRSVPRESETADPRRDLPA